MLALQVFAILLTTLILLQARARALVTLSFMVPAFPASGSAEVVHDSAGGFM
jgi:ascorbate-specific PTS system EIIC-type component UlaA